MIGLAAFLASLAPLHAALAVDGPSATIPRPAVVMLWASWCTACRAELERIPLLQQSAKPLSIVTLAIDPPEVARRALKLAGQPTANAYADGRAPASVLADWGGKGSALPLAVAIDRSGRICGTKRGLLGTDQLRHWAATCSR